MKVNAPQQRQHVEELNVIHAGSFRLSNYRPRKVGEPGKYWLSNGDGEGMEATEIQIETMLKDFFGRNF